MPKKRQYTKEAMDNAVKFVINKEGSIRQAAKKFGVPRSSIKFKIENPNTRFKSGPAPVLTESEENALCGFIIDMAKRGFPRRKDEIQQCVQDFLNKNPRPNPFKDGKPGDVWFKAFLRRHPIISFRTCEGVTNASACVSEKDIRKWFHEIKEYIDNEGLTEVIEDPVRVFNADETGFSICPKTGKVLAQKGSKNVYEIEKGSAKENITVLFTFSAAGQVLNPMIIYPYKRVPERVSLSVPSGWGVGRSDKGWMTAEVFHDYIAKCFYPQLMALEISFPVILFVDGHKTHLTIEVSELCRSLKIVLIALYPNATRILQPADVAAFRPIKAGWKKGLREWYAANDYRTNLTKESFAPLLKTVVEATNKKETLINGFRITGLFPFDANNVDYSKCIASSEESRQPQGTPATEINLDNNSCVLTYREFCDIVGETILEQCRTATALSLHCSDKNFNAIYKIWLNFNEIGDPFTNDEDMTKTRTLDMEPTLSTRNDEVLNERPDDSPHSVTENVMSNYILDECSGVFLPVQKNSDNLESSLLPFTYKEAEQIQLSDQGIKPLIEGGILMKTEKEIIAVERRESSVAYREMGTDNLYKIVCNLNKQENNMEKHDDASKNKENMAVATTSSLSENKLLTSEVIHPAKQINIISNESLTEYLEKKKRPCSPKRKGKRQTEKIPFALTSDCYLELIKAKQLKKQEEEAAKENRKRIREEKKRQKENALLTKRKKPTKKEQKFSKSETVTREPLPICCDACLSPITRRIIECCQCKKQFHLNCIPSSHRIHIPTDDDDESLFLCHICYKESNSDTSMSDDALLTSVLAESKNHGF